MNAFTAREHTGFHVKCLDDDGPEALSILVDIMSAPLIAPDDVEVERGVIVEEILERDDEPADWVHDFVLQSAFPDNPLGRDVLGTQETIEAMRRDAIADFFATNYAPSNIVLAAAGAIDHDDVVAAGDAIALRRGARPRPLPSTARSPAVPESTVAVDVQDTEQVHICIAHADRRRNARRPVRARGDRSTARRGPVVAAVPRGAREARPGVHDLQLPLAVQRRRAARDLRGHRPVEDRRHARRDRRRDWRASPTTASPRRNSTSPSAISSARSTSASRTPARAWRALRRRSWRSAASTKSTSPRSASVTCRRTDVDRVVRDLCAAPRVVAVVGPVSEAEIADSVARW